MHRLVVRFSDALLLRPKLRPHATLARVRSQRTLAQRPLTHTRTDRRGQTQLIARWPDVLQAFVLPA